MLSQRRRWWTNKLFITIMILHDILLANMIQCFFRIANIILLVGTATSALTATTGTQSTNPQVIVKYVLVHFCIQAGKCHCMAVSIFTVDATDN